MNRARPRAAPSGPPSKPVYKRWWFWLLATPLLCIGLNVVLLIAFRVMLPSNAVYLGALKRAEANGTVRAKLGTPLEVTSVDSARMSFFGPTVLVLEVQGPKGAGVLHAAASGNEPDSLEIFNMYVVLSSTGTKVRLDRSRASGAF